MYRHIVKIRFAGKKSLIRIGVIPAVFVIALVSGI